MPPSSSSKTKSLHVHILYSLPSSPNTTIFYRTHSKETATLHKVVKGVKDGERWAWVGLGDLLKDVCSKNPSLLSTFTVYSYSPLQSHRAQTPVEISSGPVSGVLTSSAGSSSTEAEERVMGIVKKDEYEEEEESDEDENEEWLEVRLRFEEAAPASTSLAPPSSAPQVSTTTITVTPNNIQSEPSPLPIPLHVQQRVTSSPVLHRNIPTPPPTSSAPAPQTSSVATKSRRKPSLPPLTASQQRQAPPSVVSGTKRKLSAMESNANVPSSTPAATTPVESISGQGSGVKPNSVTDDTGEGCSNCGRLKTSMWRAREGGGKVCNACGIYWNKFKTHRPSHLWGSSNSQRNPSGPGVDKGGFKRTLSAVAERESTSLKKSVAARQHDGHPLKKVAVAPPVGGTSPLRSYSHSHQQSSNSKAPHGSSSQPPPRPAKKDHPDVIKRLTQPLSDDEDSPSASYSMWCPPQPPAPSTMAAPPTTAVVPQDPFEFFDLGGASESNAPAVVPPVPGMSSAEKGEVARFLTTGGSSSQRPNGDFFQTGGIHRSGGTSGSPFHHNQHHNQQQFNNNQSQQIGGGLMATSSPLPPSSPPVIPAGLFSSPDASGMMSSASSVADDFFGVGGNNGYRDSSPMSDWMDGNAMNDLMNGLDNVNAFSAYDSSGEYQQINLGGDGMQPTFDSHQQQQPQPQLTFEQMMEIHVQNTLSHSQQQSHNPDLVPSTVNTVGEGDVMALVNVLKNETGGDEGAIQELLREMIRNAGGE